MCSTSMCVHGLFVVHAFAMTWGLVCTFWYSFLTSCGVDEFPSFHSLCLTSFLGWVLLDCGPLFFPIHSLISFVGWLILLSSYPVAPAMLLSDLCLLGFFWAYCMLSFCSIPVAQHYHWASTHFILGFLGPFYRFRAFLARLISLGILNPFHFLGHPWPIPILHSHGFSLSLLCFPSPNYHILYF